MTRHDVKTTLFSHQNGKQRYPSTDQNDRRPRIAHWRNNLTALSQYRNLYFVAYLDVISVFEPDFPNQRLGDPTGTIQLPASRPDLEGYLDDLTPQAANQLLVKDLGEEEILLVGDAFHSHEGASYRCVSEGCYYCITSILARSDKNKGLNMFFNAPHGFKFSSLMLHAEE